MHYFSKKAVFFLLATVIVSSITISYGQVATLEATISLKEVDGAKIMYQNGFALPSFEKQNRTILNLKGAWKKQRFNANDNITLARRDSSGYSALITEAANRHLPNYDDASWEVKQLPAVENQMYEFPTVPEYYQDGVWYRKTFTVDASNSGKFAKLIFYAVNYVADVWLNGVYLGYHEGGYTPFAFDISQVLVSGGENKLVVRVDNPAWGTRNDIVPYTNCDWFNYTGIIHDVYIEFSSPVSVIRTNIVPQSVEGDIQTTVVLNNILSTDQNVDVEIKVYKADVNATNINTERASELIGSLVSVTGVTQAQFTILSDSVKVWKTDLKVVNPDLWSPKTPNLYVMKVAVKQNGNTIDEYYTQFGIRTIKTLIDKVYLNNKPVFFPGAARHEDHPSFGRSIPIDSIYTDLLRIKDLNITMLRTAHYPNHLHTYLLADRLGIAVVEEIPVWWFDTALAWVIQNSARHIHEQMFREMVFKDYNRPSVILWSTTNECLDVTNRKAFIQKVNQDLDFNYPDGRLVTQSAAADRPGFYDPSQAAADVIGWTMYFGIFHGGTYYDTTRYFLGNANLAYPEKPILDTEFGIWSGELNSPSGQATQVTVFNETFNAFTYRASVIRKDGTYRDGGYLMGVTWWCVFDWYSHQHPSGYQSMGLYKMKRDTLKQVGTVLKNAYAPFYAIGGVVTAIDPEKDIIPSEFLLEQNYPNPFNPETKIKFHLPVNSTVSLKIFNSLGQEVINYTPAIKSAGIHEFTINMNQYQLPSGIYFYKIEAGDYQAVKKMVYLK